ncbi:MAG: 1,6-anhydro-N-acetylmuramyl-L-alanine amidase AmpD [Betaproteobacteria bacterium]|nr:1,6-anhydro-N-acetylmuramyl-L-alanine amidase AmpD [Betaproteobacteria bacterium]
MTKQTDESPSHATEWSAGWWHEAQRVTSPNFGPRPPGTVVDLVVIHSISLPPGVYGGPEVQQLFTNTLDWDAHPYFQSIRGMEVSSHFYLQRTGAILQFVSCNDRAWHAGRSHYRGRDNCNDDSIGIELEGTDEDRFTASQYESLHRLCRAISGSYQIRHIAGHEHIAPGRKTDPGPAFEWSALSKWPEISGWRFPG